MYARLAESALATETAECSRRCTIADSDCTAELLTPELRARERLCGGVGTTRGAPL